MTNAADVITVTRLGKTFRATRRTVAHLDWTVQLLGLLHPNARLVIIQPCYNTGVAASAGTHDLDAVLDFRIDGLDWWAAQKFMRQCGWACWYRFPPTFTPHLHAVSLGYPGAVGIFVPGQVDDYYRHALGLKGQHDSGIDKSWFPPNIAKTIFDYPAWLAAQEEAMPFTDWPQKDQDALVQAVAAAVTDKILNTELGNGSSVKFNIRKAGDTKALAKEIATEVKALK